MRIFNYLITVLFVSVPFVGFTQLDSINYIDQSYQNILYTLSKDTIVVGASDGFIYQSENGGQTLNNTKYDHWGTWFNDFSFPSHTTGYVCGGTAFGLVHSSIFKTTNSGKNWDSISANQFGYDLYCVDFTDVNTGYFGGVGLLVKTTDGGQSFKVDTLDDQYAVTDLHFINQNEGMYLSNNSIFRTSNGGDSWEKVYTAEKEFPFLRTYLVKMEFTNSQTGYVISRFDVLLKTTDGGKSWRSHNTFSDSTNFLDITFVNDKIGYVLVQDKSDPNRSTIFQTHNGGDSWEKYVTGASGLWRKISATQEGVLYAISYNTLYRGNISTNTIQKIQPNHNVVYPNPAINSLQITVDPIEQIERVILFDAAGKASELESLTHNRYKLPEYAVTGTYIVAIQTSSKTYHHKLQIIK